MERLVSCCSKDARFVGRSIVVNSFGDGVDVVSIPVPDALVLCDACNSEIARGWLLYVSDEAYAADEPHGAYCHRCADVYWSEIPRIEVSVDG